MFQLLHYLIYKIRTVDGHQGTADKILENLNEIEINKFLKRNNKNVISKQKKEEILHKNSTILSR